MSKKITIYDTTLRDGAQREGVLFSHEDKLDIISVIDSLGVDFIEAGMPASNPTDKMLFSSLPQTSAQTVAFGSTCKPNTDAEKDPSVNILINNPCKWVSIVGKSWIRQVETVLKVDGDENLRMISDTIKCLKKHGKNVIFDAEHFFDGYKDNKEYTLSTLVEAQNAGVDVICLCDTNGGSLPKEVFDAVSDVVSIVSIDIGIHCHNDSELAVACSLAAVEAGATMVQGTINGMGERCGNANLCSVVPDLMLKMGYDTSVDLKKLTETSNAVSNISNTHIDPFMPFVGKSAFAHKGGLHIDASVKNKGSYEHIQPELVGNIRSLVVSELSGRAVITNKLEQFGIQYKTDDVSAILARIKEKESQGYQFGAADASLELLMRRVCESLVPPFSIPTFRLNIDVDANGRLKSEASIKIKDVNGNIEHTASDGDGPVDALSNSMKKALSKFFPEMDEIRLIDYKVRVLDEKAATAAAVSVIIKSTDGVDVWSTVGVSTNVIEASLIALIDSLEYGIMIYRRR